MGDGVLRNEGNFESRIAQRLDGARYGLSLRRHRHVKVTHSGIAGVNCGKIVSKN